MDNTAIVPIEIITKKIFVIRKQRVMLDRDLATLYGVTTKALNQAAKRNIERFPDEFMFQLSPEETVNLRSQFVTANISAMSRSLPFVFSEHGAYMLSSVIHSPNAIKVSILIIKAFTRLRNMLASHEDLRRKVAELEGRQNKTDEDIQMLISAVNMLMESPPEETRNKIGFI